MRKLSSLFLAALLLASFCLLGQIIDVKTTSAHSGVEVLSRLHVDGNLIKNESGATVILRGINIADPYVLQLEGHFSETDFSFIVENWHPNIIRVPIHPRWWSPTYIDDYLVPLVSWGQKYKVYILLDYHDFGNPSNRLNLIKSTWNDIVSRFAGNPAVLYDIFNEPHSMFWFQWKPMAEDIIATIRSVDPDSLIFVGGVDWGYSLVGAGSNPISYDNIVYSTHPYPMKSTPWDTYFGFLTSSHPVFAGEWGFIDDGSGEVWDADRTYAVRLLYYLEKKGMSWAAWCLHPTWRPNLLQDWTYTPTESGYLIKDWLLESHLDSYEVGGLRSQYFDNKNFTDLGIERINPSIDFDWGSGSPDVAIGSETFSARWIGKVKVDFAETFTFHTYTDDGARLWVDGQFLINKWVDQAATEWSGSITLDIGLHSILLEYYENTGSAVARLSWSSPSVAKETIPNSHLSHMVHPIYDTTPPEFYNLTIFPPAQQINLNVNVSADVIDDVRVSSVLLNMTSPSSGTSNVTMTSGMGDSFYLNQSYSELGSYDFAIWASDTNGNWNSTAGSFVVENTLPPAAPFVLDAYLTGPKWEDVALTWLLSSDDGMGSEDVVRYDIYRNVTAYDGLGMGYQLHDSVPAGMFTYLDSGAGEGNPEDFFYYVCAVDSANMSACSSGQMGKITHHLLTGPQLISIPLVQKDPSIEKVLQTLIFDYAWAYDNSATTDEWIAFSVSKPYDGSMQTIDRRKAVWVNVTTESNMTVAGVVPKKTIINLTRGWNLVGYPSFHNKAASDALEGVPFERLEGFDQLASPYFLRVLDDSSVFAASHGYWILVQTDSSWTLVN